MSDQVQLLNEAMDKLQAEHGEEIISVSRVVNPLLGIWGLANDIDRSVAVPIEQLLAALTGRNITTPTEIAEAMNATRTALALLVTL